MPAYLQGIERRVSIAERAPIRKATFTLPTIVKKQVAVTVAPISGILVKVDVDGGSRLVRRSGTSWALVNAEPPGNSVKLIKLGDSHWLVGSGEAYRSDDGGTVWVQKNTIETGIYDIARVGDTLWAGSVAVEGNGAIKSINNGDSWEFVHAVPPNSFNAFTVAQTGNSICVLTSGINEPGVFNSDNIQGSISDDGGDSWADLVFNFDPVATAGDVWQYAHTDLNTAFQCRYLPNGRLVFIVVGFTDIDGYNQIRVYYSDTPSIASSYTPVIVEDIGWNFFLFDPGLTTEGAPLFAWRNLTDQPPTVLPGIGLFKSTDGATWDSIPIPFTNLNIGTECCWYDATNDTLWLLHTDYVGGFGTSGIVWSRTGEGSWVDRTDNLLAAAGVSAATGTYYGGICAA